MEDFGYSKNFEKKPKKIKNKNYFIWLSLTISISLFAIISFKGYELIYENKEIETIHSPIFAIKILPEDEDALRLSNNNSNIVYEDIFGQNKEGLKGKHNIIDAPAPAIPEQNLLKNEEKPEFITNIASNDERLLPAEDIIMPTIDKINKLPIDNKIVNLNEEEKPEKNSHQTNSTDLSSKNIGNQLQNKNLGITKKPQSKNKIEESKIIIFNQKNKDKEAKNINNKESKNLISSQGGGLLNINEKQSSIIKNLSQNQKNDNQKKDKPRIVRVQIAAMSSKSVAEANWQKLKTEHSKIFNKLKPFIEEINLGKKGSFYRLQVGNFFNQVEADEFCIKYINATHKNKADCIVVE